MPGSAGDFPLGVVHRLLTHEFVPLRVRYDFSSDEPG